MAQSLTEIPISCDCGALQGRLSLRPGDRPNRLVCYCDDCQAFAQALGRSDDSLDAHGGTEVVQVSPACLRFGAGVEQLACLRLTPKGLLRWHTRCCAMPIGNTMATRFFPFVGLVARAIDCEKAEKPLDELVGPRGKGVFAQFAKGDRSGLDAHDRAPLSLMATTLWKVLRRRLRGDHRRSPFFDAVTGAPIATPRVLSLGEQPDLAARARGDEALVRERR